MGQLALHAVKPRLAQSRGQAGDDGLEDAAHAVRVLGGSPDGLLHGDFFGRVQQREMSRLRLGQHQSRRAGQRRVLDAGALGDVGVYPDAQRFQHALADRPRGHRRGGDAAGEVSPAACVLKAVVLGVGGVVRVAGTQKVGGLGVIAAAGVGVAHHQRDGGAGGVAVHYAGEELHFVRLGAGGGKPIPAGAAAVHGGGDGGGVHRQSGGQPVQHRAHRRTVAFAKNRHADGISVGVFQEKPPVIPLLRCPAGRPAR